MKRNNAEYPIGKLMMILILLALGCLSSPAIASDNSVFAPLVTRSLLLDAQRVENKFIVIGERGHILISVDSGMSWKQAQVPTRATLTGVYFTDRAHGWVVGHDQVILRTQDGGTSWELVYEDADAESPLLDIYFTDGQHGFAIGAYGFFLETFDAGSHWTKRYISEDDFHLNQIQAVGDKLYIAAEAGFAYRSDDGGVNWVVLSPDYMGSFFGLLPLTEKRLLLFGLRGNLFRSEDAGETWVKIETATQASLTDGLRLQDGTLVVVGMAGTLLVSHDNGDSFKLHQDPDRRGFSSLLETTGGEIVAVGDFGVTKLSLTNLNTEK